MKSMAWKFLSGFKLLFTILQIQVAKPDSTVEKEISNKKATVGSAKSKTEQVIRVDVHAVKKDLEGKKDVTEKKGELSFH